MEYHKKADLKVECIATQEDFDFFGITLDDILDRTKNGMYFLKKAKELCAMTQGVEWTDVAYTLNITMLPDGSVSFEFSECIGDYAASLRHSLAMADKETRGRWRSLSVRSRRRTKTRGAGLWHILRRISRRSV